MNYLSEHNAGVRGFEKNFISLRYIPNEVSAQIKAEKSMAEIAVLRTHIVNYTKTCEVYVAYHQAGYSLRNSGGT